MGRITLTITEQDAVRVDGPAVIRSRTLPGKGRRLRLTIVAEKSTRVTRLSRTERLPDSPPRD